MTIEIVKGCLLEAFDKGKVDIIGHVVNCQGVMGSGLAKSIKRKHPEVFEFYTETLSDFDSFDQDPLGHVEWVSLNEDSTRGVINFYAQRFYGVGDRHLNYGALSNGFHWLVSHLVEGSTLGLPYKLGCDRAGGDWEIVLEMIEFYFKDFDVKIYQLEN